MINNLTSRKVSNIFSNLKSNKKSLPTISAQELNTHLKIKSVNVVSASNNNKKVERKSSSYRLEYSNIKDEVKEDYIKRSTSGNIPMNWVPLKQTNSSNILPHKNMKKKSSKLLL